MAHPTPRKLRHSADYYAQAMVKYSGIAEYHSYAEYLNGGLMEGDPTIESWVPQPFRFRLGRAFYIPDVYVKYKDGRRVIHELKPRAEFDPDRREQLQQFCAFHDVVFDVIANEWVLARELLAENWLLITRTLVSATAIDTDHLERDIIDRFISVKEGCLGDFVDPGNPEGSFLNAIALFRLCHRGHLLMQLDKAPLDYNTVVTLP